MYMAIETKSVPIAEITDYKSCNRKTIRANNIKIFLEEVNYKAPYIYMFIYIYISSYSVPGFDINSMSEVKIMINIYVMWSKEVGDCSTSD